MNNNFEHENSKKTMPLGTAFCKIISALSKLDRVEKVGNRLAFSRRNLAKAVILTKKTNIGLTLEEKSAWEEFVRQISFSFYARLVGEKNNINNM